MKETLNQWSLTEHLNRPHNIDPEIMKIMMENSWFMTDDKDKQHKLYEWLPNTDFSLLVETLGGGNNISMNQRFVRHVDNQPDHEDIIRHNVPISTTST